jgi:hydrogenase expression/formation protein HypC
MCLAIPGQVLAIDDSARDELGRTARVSFGGVVKTVNMAYVPEAVEGDYVVVHVGFALSRVDEAEARQVFEYLRKMDELSELNDANEAIRHD